MHIRYTFTIKYEQGRIFTSRDFGSGVNTLSKVYVTTLSCAYFKLQNASTFIIEQMKIHL